MLEADQLKDPAFYPEASDYLAEYIREHKLSEYLTLIKESKKECPIPIIASINCYSDSEWIDFAKQIETAGADALEINILALQKVVFKSVIMNLFLVVTTSNLIISFSENLASYPY